MRALILLCVTLTALGCSTQTALSKPNGPATPEAAAASASPISMPVSDVVSALSAIPDGYAAPRSPGSPSLHAYLFVDAASEYARVQKLLGDAGISVTLAGGQAGDTVPPDAELVVR